MPQSGNHLLAKTRFGSAANTSGGGFGFSKLFSKEKRSENCRATHTGTPQSSYLRGCQQHHSVAPCSDTKLQIKAYLVAICNFSTAYLLRPLQTVTKPCKRCESPTRAEYGQAQICGPPLLGSCTFIVCMLIVQRLWNDADDWSLRRLSIRQTPDDRWGICCPRGKAQTELSIVHTRSLSASIWPSQLSRFSKVMKACHRLGVAQWLP